MQSVTICFFLNGFHKVFLGISNATVLLLTNDVFKINVAFYKSSLQNAAMLDISGPCVFFPAALLWVQL